MNDFLHTHPDSFVVLTIMALTPLFCVIAALRDLYLERKALSQLSPEDRRKAIAYRAALKANLIRPNTHALRLPSNSHKRIRQQWTLLKFLLLKFPSKTVADTRITTTSHENRRPNSPAAPR